MVLYYFVRVKSFRELTYKFQTVVYKKKLLTRTIITTSKCREKNVLIITFCVRLRRHHAGGIWTDAASFQRLGLLSTLIRHENRAFRKCTSNWRNSITWLCVWTENILKTEIFWKRWHHVIHDISLSEVYSTTNPKWPVIVAFSNSFGVV